MRFAFLPIIKTHWVAAVVSIAVGLIYASHHFFVPLFLPQHTLYHPLTSAAYLDEATFYGLRAHAVYQGAWRAGDISLVEYQNAPSMLSVLNPLILGMLANIAGSFEAGVMISDFLFPAAIFLLIYALAWELTKRRGISLLFAFIFLFAPKTGMYLPPISSVHMRELITAIFPFWSADTPLYFSHFEEPKLTFPFLVLSMLLILRAILHNRMKLYLLAGAGLGILFYTYLYDWASLLVGLMAMAALFGIWRDRARFFGVLVIIGTGFFISLPHWLNVGQLFLLPHVGELVDRTGRELSHQLRFAPVWKTYFRNSVLIGVLLMLARQAEEQCRIKILFLVSLLATYFVTVNAQAVIGFNIQPDHWYRTQFLPVGFVLLFFAAHFLPRFTPLWHVGTRRIALCGMMGYLIASQAYGQYLFSKKYADAFTIPAAREQVFVWLNKETQKNSVIAALSSEFNRELLLRTHNKVFIPNGLNTIASEQEIWNRLFAASRLFGIAPDDFGRMLGKNDMAYYLFSERFASRSFDAAFKPGWERVFSDELIAEQTNAYAAYAAQAHAPPLPQLDYLLFDEASREFGAREGVLTAFFKKVYDGDGIRIYRYSSL